MAVLCYGLRLSPETEKSEKMALPLLFSGR